MNQIQTAIRGRTPQEGKLHLSDFEIKHTDAGKPVQVTCHAGQHVSIRQGSKRKGFVAHFDAATCRRVLSINPGKRDPRFHLYFTQPQAQVSKRRRRSVANQQEGRNLRAEVEATV